jgi:hypothetical protein
VPEADARGCRDLPRYRDRTTLGCFNDKDARPLNPEESRAGGDQADTDPLAAELNSL